ncbi:hypothetical protein G6F31_019971 [Rhizopus arrhizus]|nr:hypothetical protein G6F31_019971 [Rhizopus arrhizus]
MPRRRLARVGFLDQQMIVIQARAWAAHQLRGDRPDTAVEDESAVVFVLGPVAEILEEPAGGVCRAGNLGARAGRSKIRFDAARQQRDFVRREQLAHADGAIFLKGLDHRGGKFEFMTVRQHGFLLENHERWNDGAGPTSPRRQRAPGGFRETRPER